MTTNPPHSNRPSRHTATQKHLVFRIRVVVPRRNHDTFGGGDRGVLPHRASHHPTVVPFHGGRATDVVGCRCSRTSVAGPS